MDTYQVSFYHLYPECECNEDTVKTAFVLANSFDGARLKVEQWYKRREFESARVIGILKPERVEIFI